ncbi:hypothetical protein [Labrys sp. ZIDIC5]|uniref:hypothetical protein n=1 Tax=Labrys sedimenti TaxID=3106036 RepID=UPI002AC9F513|nr:hypothetical protein [Labrys sp. ZIDIC5]MDZ5454867.1 hypothetical protein [Labrys sp. ZIDIC5]
MNGQALDLTNNIVDLEDVELDRHIYRITKQEFVFNLFRTNQNVLTQVHKWKDKFENFLLASGGTLNGETFDYGFKNSFAGQCWTTERYSEAMWGIYAPDPDIRYVRIRSTPRLLIKGLAEHTNQYHETCYVGKVSYKREKSLQQFLDDGQAISLSPSKFARSLLMKRRAFRHESEIRLLYFGEEKLYSNGLYRYIVDPHQTITQIMADPNRDRQNWEADKEIIRSTTGFQGPIKRSKIYDPPRWTRPSYALP